LQPPKPLDENDMLSRRKFLIGLGVAGSLGALGGVSALWSAAALADLAEKIVIKYTQDLNVAADDIRTFALDYAGNPLPGLRNHFFVYFLNKIYLSDSIMKAISGEWFDKIRLFERKVITGFVLSTNIPSMKNTLQEPVQYFGYSPDSLCNPVAR
jgi:hypothetical protein